jgi:hypothetical protein
MYSLQHVDINLVLSRLLRLLDQRYRGVAVGVGQSEILGRIHVAPIKVCLVVMILLGFATFHLRTATT